MDTARMTAKVRFLEERQSALRWLEAYGVKLTGRDAGQAEVSVYASLARGCDGRSFAEKTLSAYATLALPEFVASAIECCRNDIAGAKDAIREELDREPTP